MAPDRLGQLIDTHGPALVLYARQWCATPDDAVQRAFVKLSRHEPAEPVPWLFKAVRNEALAAGRAERRRLLHETRAASASWFAPVESSRLDGEAATAALERLPPDEREVIVAHLWGGLTFEQIGPLIDASAATAFRRYTSGIAELRKLLEKPCPIT